VRTFAKDTWSEGGRPHSSIPKREKSNERGLTENVTRNAGEQKGFEMQGVKKNLMSSVVGGGSDGFWC